MWVHTLSLAWIAMVPCHIWKKSENKPDRLVRNKRFRFTFHVHVSEACHSPQCVGKSVVQLENWIFHTASKDKIRVRDEKHMAHCRIYDGCLHAFASFQFWHCLGQRLWKYFWCRKKLTLQSLHHLFFLRDPTEYETLSPLTRGRKQVHFSKHCVFRNLEFRTMDKIHNPSDSESYTPWSEPFRFYEKIDVDSCMVL
jgi:hypothetical protein